MNNNIIICLIIVLIGVLIYKFFIKSEHFGVGVPNLLAPNIAKTNDMLSTISETDFRNYLDKKQDGTYTIEASANVNPLNAYLLLSNNEKKAKSPFLSGTAFTIEEILLTNKLMGYSDNLRDLIICAYLIESTPETDRVKLFFIEKNITCPSSPSSPSSSDDGKKCFIGSSLVLMADHTTKEIKDVKIDDMVISAKTGLPQKILLIDVPPITSCELYGLNEYEPFATTNHPFISHDDKLLVIDTKSAINISKHDSNMVKEIQINDVLLSFDEKIKPITVENINIKKYNDIQLFNIITEDHTFFVNNFGVHDNSFNYECYKTESLRMGLMVLLSTDIINDFTFEELFNKYHQEVMNTPLNMDDYYEYFNKVVELCHNQKCLDFLYYLWCNKFDLFQ